MPFIPHSEQDIDEMLQTIGAESMEQLFDEIPAELRVDHLQGIPPQLNELQVAQLMEQRADEDGKPLSFLGAGAYQHHIPAAIWQITTRGEFYSAYTPYQAEASQGTLQLIYEFQSMMTALTGMQVSNASLYDGATALAEAVLMAVRGNRKSKSRRVLMPRNVHPRYRQVASTIVKNQKIELLDVPFNLHNGQLDQAALEAYSGEDITAVVIAQPNFFGTLEQVNALTDWAHAQKALVIAVVNPTSLALLQAPGSWGEQGADIVVGEGQPLGVPLSSGGPYFGFMCATKALMRQMPGRIVGKTVDLDGTTGYALTLQAREQHIRRSKATSNICTNQGLVVTAATQYMAMMGARGLRSVAESCHHNTRKLTEMLCQIPGISVYLQGPVFHEQLLKIEVDSVPRLLLELENKNILGGWSVESDFAEFPGGLLINATEVHSDAQMTRFCEQMAACLSLQAPTSTSA